MAPSGKKSWFLFGPQQTGKSTYVRSLLIENDLDIDLLPQRGFVGYSYEPGRIRDEVLAHALLTNSYLRFISSVAHHLPTRCNEVDTIIL